MRYPETYVDDRIDGYNTIDENTRKNQNNRILQHLLVHGTITQSQADDLKVRRLSARIFDLRKDGIDIVTETIYGKNEYGPTRFAQYRLV